MIEPKYKLNQVVRLVLPTSYSGNSVRTTKEYIRKIIAVELHCYHSPDDFSISYGVSIGKRNRYVSERYVLGVVETELSAAIDNAATKE